MRKSSFVWTRLNGSNSSCYLVQPCLSQEGQNASHVDVLEQVTQTIHPEKLLSDLTESFTFYGNMFNNARRLICQTLWLWFLSQYNRVSKPCMANTQSEYNDLFASWFSENWSPFSQSELGLEEFVVNVIPVLLPFCVKKFIYFGFRSVYAILDLSGVRSMAD